MCWWTNWWYNIVELLYTLHSTLENQDEGCLFRLVSVVFGYVALFQGIFLHLSHYNVFIGMNTFIISLFPRKVDYWKFCLMAVLKKKLNLETVDLVSFLFAVTEPTGLCLIGYISLMAFQKWRGLVSFSVCKFWWFDVFSFFVRVLQRIQSRL